MSYVNQSNRSVLHVVSEVGSVRYRTILQILGPDRP